MEDGAVIHLVETRPPPPPDSTAPPPPRFHAARGPGEQQTNVSSTIPVMNIRTVAPGVMMGSITISADSLSPLSPLTASPPTGNAGDASGNGAGRTIGNIMQGAFQSLSMAATPILTSLESSLDTYEGLDATSDAARERQAQRQRTPMAVRVADVLRRVSRTVDSSLGLSAAHTSQTSLSSQASQASQATQASQASQAATQSEGESNVSSQENLTNTQTETTQTLPPEVARMLNVRFCFLLSQLHSY